MDKNSILSKFISTQGYKKNSPDKNRPMNVIPSNQITMSDVEFPVIGVDNLGNQIIMQPGRDYTFPGDYVVETPMAQKGGGIPIKNPPSGKIPPLFVDDANDPRYKSYQDSLKYYNEDKKFYSEYVNDNSMKEFFPSYDEVVLKSKNNQEHYIVNGSRPIIMNISEGTLGITDTFGHGDKFGGLSMSSLSQKPHQKVFAKGTPQYDAAKKQEELVNAGYNIGPTGIDGDWGKNSQKAWDEYQKTKTTKPVSTTVNNPVKDTIVPTVTPTVSKSNSWEEKGYPDWNNYSSTVRKNNQAFGSTSGTRVIVTDKTGKEYPMNEAEYAEYYNWLNQTRKKPKLEQGGVIPEEPITQKGGWLDSYQDGREVVPPMFRKYIPEQPTTRQMTFAEYKQQLSNNYDEATVNSILQSKQMTNYKPNDIVGTYNTSIPQRKPTQKEIDVQNRQAEILSKDKYFNEDGSRNKNIISGINWTPEGRTELAGMQAKAQIDWEQLPWQDKAKSIGTDVALAALFDFGLGAKMLKNVVSVGKDLWKPTKYISSVDNVPTEIYDNNLLNVLNKKTGAVNNEIENIGKLITKHEDDLINNSIKRDKLRLLSNDYEQKIREMPYYKAKNYEEFKLRQQLGETFFSNKNEYYNKIADAFTKTDKGIVITEKAKDLTKTGKTNFIDFTTGENIVIDVNVPSGNIKKEIFIEGDKFVVKTVPNFSVESKTNLDDYIKLQNKNISFIEKIPHTKVFGSSKGVSDANLPHLTSDYDALITRDAYDRHVANKLDFIKTNGPAQTHTINPKYGEKGHIDFNIIEKNKNGKATGDLATELYYQIEPEDYYKQLKNQIKNNKPGEIDIPYTPEELLSKTDPATKTILDSYLSTKPKHINSIDGYLTYANPKKVKLAQEQYIKMLVGNKGNLGVQFGNEHFTNIDENLLLLDEINFIGDKSIVAKSSEKMQNAINDYYINNTVLSRGVYQKTKNIKDLDSAFKNWSETHGGGTGNGIGLNHVLHGDSNMGQIYGNKQVFLNLDKSSPKAYIQSIKQKTDGFLVFTPEEQEIVDNIVKKYNGVSGNNTYTIINNNSGIKQNDKLIRDIAEATGKRISTGKEYNSSIFASTLDDFDNYLDALEYGYKNQVVVPKSYISRMRNVKNKNIEQLGNFSFLNKQPGQSITDYDKKEFYKIKSILEKGIESINTKYQRLSQQVKDLEIANRDNISNATSRKFAKQYDMLFEADNKILSEKYNLEKQRTILYEKLYRMQKIGKQLKWITGSTVGGIGVGILSDMMPESQSGKLQKRPPHLELEKKIETSTIKKAKYQNDSKANWLNKYE